MKYVGSKNRHAKEILSAIDNEVGIIKYLKFFNWVEPFVGGCNMIDKVGKLPLTRYGNDINQYIICMFRSLQNGWTPPDNISEELYKELQAESKSHYSIFSNRTALIGFAGIGCSYSGKWFGGYARGKDNNGNDRNYCLESKKNLLAQANNLKDVTFTSGDYKEMYIPELSIVYCDPPYQDTTKYKDSIEHKEFWDWCNVQTSIGNKVFVSEYSAPEGWRCIWEKVVNSSLTKETGSKKAIEKLFTK
jgi:DNA adenine methylase